MTVDKMIRYAVKVKYFLRLLRNIPLPNFKVEVKLRFQEVSPRFQLLTIRHSIIEVFLKRLIVKQLTLKLQNST